MELLLIIITPLALLVAYTGISGAPWVPVRSFHVENLLDDAGVKTNTTYIELGCGDGRLIKAAARRGARAVGYELNPLLWLVASVRCLGDSQAHIKFGNFWRVNLGNADVVMAFLVPRTMPRLAQKAGQEMKPNAILISYVFPIVGQVPLTKPTKQKHWYTYRPSRFNTIDPTPLQGVSEGSV